jgi:hypothetical protein
MSNAKLAVVYTPIGLPSGQKKKENLKEVSTPYTLTAYFSNG